jgi:fatty-acyl-CoA synthase
LRAADAGNENADEPMIQELLAFCASGLAKFKVPRYLRFVPSFPMTASGKIQKYKLREEHERMLAAAGS